MAKGDAPVPVDDAQIESKRTRIRDLSVRLDAERAKEREAEPSVDEKTEIARVLDDEASRIEAQLAGIDRVRKKRPVKPDPKGRT